ncbi:60S ribosomal subunit assembly/export protein [Vermiconidia calcicola]|uniref:60S ribosomal subunit assembly/export protein n=1 Tax=Vermiconidia calcicola TaxID=1690605 RepID=A0ACC3MIA0_9PEZI|nr:60S ribosomal subunit assembly/export protein [Vermiconidia calcicola]
MPTKVKTGSTKGNNKRSTAPSKSGSGSGSSSKRPKPTSSKPTATQHKPKSTTASTSIKKTRKPPHLRYSEKELKIPSLNGIKPTGVQKVPNKKKGKIFVEDGEGMRAIMAMVMAEKEGDVESKMMRARRMEEVREAKKAEAEKREAGRREGFEGRKEEIRMKGKEKRKRRGVEEIQRLVEPDGAKVKERTPKKAKKKVSFG